MARWLQLPVGLVERLCLCAGTGRKTAVTCQWSLATALSLLVWFVFAPQCIATLATVRRETNSWRMALLMASYMFALAYAASAATYHLTVALGG